MEEEKMDKKEQIGFHKGSLSTLAKERAELMKMVSVVEQLMQMHVKGLQELGVDLTKEVNASKETKGKKKPIEDILK
jgi:hypothetical protein